jgi:hypothetical protein
MSSIARVRRAAGERLVGSDRLLDLGSDPHDRVERAHRILEHHREVRAAHPLELLRRQREQVALAVPREVHVAGRAGGRRRHQPGDRPARDALAAAALADQPEDLALADGERHAVDRADDAGVGRDVRAEVLDLEHGRRRGVSHRA